MAIQEFEGRDWRFARNKENIVLRFDPEDTVRLPCGCIYDEALRTPEGNEVMLVRKIEMRRRDGEWVPYPSIFLIDSDDLFQTTAIVRITGKEYCCPATSPDLSPDFTLLGAAKEAGLCTEEWE